MGYDNVKELILHVDDDGHSHFDMNRIIEDGIGRWNFDEGGIES